jgi:hypothetical protein
MVCGTFTESGVPDSQLAHRKAMWVANGATSVTSTADGGGMNTITAVFPPCPPTTSHATNSASPGD